jgi:hypothetical protein
MLLLGCRALGADHVQPQPHAAALQRAVAPALHKLPELVAEDARLGFRVCGM